MMPPDESGSAAASAPPASLVRLLSCIRMDEVCVLQGAPLIGACFAMADFSPATLLAVAGIVAGNLCLMAHVFVLNDWSGVLGDLRDPHRAAGTYLAKGESAMRMGALALALLALGLGCFALVGAESFVIALVIAVFSAVYSFPGIHGKGVPVLSSLLHLFGGMLHFLLGYSALAPTSPQSVAIGCYFGLVFAAGHLTHEVRDHDGDAHNGIRTNAVAFGRKNGFLAGLLLFGAAYGLLTVLALCGVVPAVLSLSMVLFAVHLHAAVRALKHGLSYAGVRRLQDVYRNIHVLIGLLMLAFVPPW